MSEAKDWAGELISGQTGTGRILVSKLGLNHRAEIWDHQQSRCLRAVDKVCYKSRLHGYPYNHHLNSNTSWLKCPLSYTYDNMTYDMISHDWPCHWPNFNCFIILHHIPSSSPYLTRSDRQTTLSYNIYDILWLNKPNDDTLLLNNLPDCSWLTLSSVLTSTGFYTICQSFDENSQWVIDGISTNSKSINNWISGTRWIYPNLNWLIIYW